MVNRVNRYARNSRKKGSMQKKVLKVMGIWKAKKGRKSEFDKWIG